MIVRHRGTKNTEFFQVFFFFLKFQPTIFKNKMLCYMICEKLCNSFSERYYVPYSIVSPVSMCYRFCHSAFCLVDRVFLTSAMYQENAELVLDIMYEFPCFVALEGREVSNSNTHLKIKKS